MSNFYPLVNKAHAKAITKKSYKAIRKGLGNIVDKMLDLKDDLSRAKKSLPRSIRNRQKRIGYIYDIPAALAAVFLYSLFYLYTGGMSPSLTLYPLPRSIRNQNRNYIFVHSKTVLKYIINNDYSFILFSRPSIDGL